MPPGEASGRGRYGLWRMFHMNLSSQPSHLICQNQWTARWMGRGIDVTDVLQPTSYRQVSHLLHTKASQCGPGGNSLPAPVQLDWPSGHVYMEYSFHICSLMLGCLSLWWSLFQNGHAPIPVGLGPRSAKLCGALSVCPLPPTSTIPSGGKLNVCVALRYTPRHGKGTRLGWPQDVQSIPRGNTQREAFTFQQEK